MVHWAFIAITALHGLIHLMGVAKAFELAELAELKLPISKPWGVAWLAVALLVLTAAGLRLAHHDLWLAATIVAACASQAVVIRFWSDAKFGTIANVLMIAGAVALHYRG